MWLTKKPCGARMAASAGGALGPGVGVVVGAVVGAVDGWVSGVGVGAGPVPTPTWPVPVFEDAVVEPPPAHAANATASNAQPASERRPR
jgi:hypothetical protein